MFRKLPEKLLLLLKKPKPQIKELIQNTHHTSSETQKAQGRLKTVDEKIISQISLAVLDALTEQKQLIIFTEIKNFVREKIFDESLKIDESSTESTEENKEDITELKIENPIVDLEEQINAEIILLVQEFLTKKQQEQEYKERQEKTRKPHNDFSQEFNQIIKANPKPFTAKETTQSPVSNNNYEKKLILLFLKKLERILPQYNCGAYITITHNRQLHDISLEKITSHFETYNINTNFSLDNNQTHEILKIETKNLHEDYSIDIMNIIAESKKMKLSVKTMSSKIITFLLEHYNKGEKQKTVTLLKQQSNNNDNIVTLLRLQNILSQSGAKTILSPLSKYKNETYIQSLQFDLSQLSNAINKKYIQKEI